MKAAAKARWPCPLTRTAAIWIEVARTQVVEVELFASINGGVRGGADAEDQDTEGVVVVAI